MPAMRFRSLLNSVIGKRAARVDPDYRSNAVDMAPELREHIDLQLLGEQSHVKIGRLQEARDVRIQIGSRAKVVIGDGCILRNVKIYAADDTQLIIGTDVAFNNQIRLLLHEPGTIEIGNGCLFARQTDVTLSDMHSIVDIKTGERLNPAKNIYIGDMVWIGLRSTILKGVTIGPESVIGAGSVVTNDVPPNCIAAGAPARVVRSGITWKHQLI